MKGGKEASPHLKFLGIVDLILDILLRFEVDSCEGRLRVGQHRRVSSNQSGQLTMVTCGWCDRDV